MPWNAADRAPEGRPVAQIAHRFVEGALRHAERNARVQAALRIERRKQPAEAVVAHHQMVERQLAIREPHFVQILAAHGVVAARHGEARRVARNQHAADAFAPRQAVDAGEHHEHRRFVGAADQRLGAVEHEPVAADIRIGAVIGDIGAGVGLGHADRQHMGAGADAGQDLRA